MCWRSRRSAKCCARASRLAEPARPGSGEGLMPGAIRPLRARTWPATSGNGLPAGLRRDPGGSPCAAAAGATIRAVCGSRAGMAIRPTAAPTWSAFAAPALPRLAELMRLAGGLLLAGLAALSGMEQAIGRPLAFIGGTVIDGTGRAPVQDAVLLVDGQRVVALGAPGKVGIPEDAARIDIAGRWI